MTTPNLDSLLRQVVTQDYIIQMMEDKLIGLKKQIDAKDKELETWRSSYMASYLECLHCRKGFLVGISKEESICDSMKYCSHKCYCYGNKI